MGTSFKMVAVSFVLAAAGIVVAADAPKEVTLKGTMECAKCELHETKTCQDALKVSEGDKSVIYYLDDNKVAKDYHKNVCTAPKENVTVTGTVSEKDGKKVIEATKIE